MPSKIVVPFIRSPYNYDRDEASSESALTCNDKSLTLQSEMEQADINVIMRKFGHGELPAAPLSPHFGDFSGINDYHSALNAVAVAGEEFDKLPATLRARFNNDPAQLVAFIDNDANYDEAMKLGLVPEKLENVLKVTTPPPAVVPAKPDVGGIGGSAPDAKPVAS